MDKIDEMQKATDEYSELCAKQQQAGDMKRIKANQIADGYLSEGMDEGINPEYFIAEEVDAEIDELVDMLEEVVEAEYLHQTMSERVIPKAKTLIAKHKKEE